MPKETEIISNVTVWCTNEILRKLSDALSLARFGGARIGLIPSSELHELRDQVEHSLKQLDVFLSE